MIFYPTSAHAGAEVSVSGGPWAIGTIKGSGVAATGTEGRTDDKWTVTGSIDGTEDVYIKVDGTNWHPGSTSGTNQFILKHDVTGSWGSAITNSGDGILLKSLAVAGTQKFDLQFTAPSSSEYEGVEQTLTVTLTATNYVAPFVCGTSTVTDADGNIYNTVLIGTQCWMRENMMTTKYPSGASIARGPTTATWDGVDHGYYAYPPNTGNTAEETLANIQSGKLGFVYQWSAAMNGAASCNGTGESQPACTTPVQGVCPSGWHIPSHYELTALERAVCTSGTCATDFPYDTTTTGWRGTGEGTTLKTVSASSFSGLLAGYRYTTGAFYLRGTDAYFWSSLESGANAWYRSLNSTGATVLRIYYNKAYGLSVRCLKD